MNYVTRLHSAAAWFERHKYALALGVAIAVLLGGAPESALAFPLLAGATDANYVASPALGMGQLTVANTNRDGTTGTYVDILTGAADGTRVFRIVMAATVTTTAGMIRFFIYDGTNARLYKEVPVAAVTPSGTVAAWTTEIETPDLILPSTSHVLRASINNAEATNVFAHGGAF